MRVVIEMPEAEYKKVKEGRASVSMMREAIRNGTPLQKGHGRLIDGEKIANEIDALKDNWNRYGNEYESGRYESYDYAVDTIEGAPTIIEADKQEGKE